MEEIKGKGSPEARAMPVQEGRKVAKKPKPPQGTPEAKALPLREEPSSLPRPKEPEPKKTSADERIEKTQEEAKQAKAEIKRVNPEDKEAIKAVNDLATKRKVYQNPEELLKFSLYLRQYVPQNVEIGALNAAVAGHIIELLEKNPQLQPGLERIINEAEKKGLVEKGTLSLFRKKLEESKEAAIGDLLAPGLAGQIPSRTIEWFSEEDLEELESEKLVSLGKEIKRLKDLGLWRDRRHLERLYDKLGRLLIEAEIMPEEIGIAYEWIDGLGREFRSLLRFDIRAGLTPQEIDKIIEGDWKEVDQIFFEIFKPADLRPTSSFREAFTLYDQTKLSQFFLVLEERLRKLHPEDLKKRMTMMTYYVDLAALKEVYHNIVYFVEAGRDLETLLRYGQTYQAKFADLTFGVAGVEQAAHCYERALYQIKADNHGWLPAEQLAWSHVAGREGSRWEKLAWNQFELMHDAGLIRDREGNQVQLTDWEKSAAMSLARGFGMSTIRSLEIVASGKVAPEFGSIYGETIARGLDPIEHLIEKFHIGGPGFAILFFDIETGDVKDALDMFRHRWTKENTREALHEKPKKGKRMVDILNLLKMSSRFGPHSQWGPKRAAEEWSQEELDNLGFAIRLAAVRSEVEYDFEEEFKKRVKGKKWPKGKQEWEWRKEKAAKKEAIDREVWQRSREILSEVAEKMPLKMAHEWVNDEDLGEGWEWKRYEIAEEVLGDEAEAILRIDGEYLTIEVPDKKRPGKTTTKEITSFKDVFQALKEHRGAKPKYKLPKEKLDALKKMRTKIWSRLGQMETDLGIVQEKYVLERRDLDFTIIRDERRRELARRYAARITEVAKEKFGEDSFENPQSYVGKLAFRITKEGQRFLLGTEDTRFSLLEYDRMGGNTFARRLNDYHASVEAAFKIGRYLSTAIVGHPDEREILKQLKEIQEQIAVYDRNIAYEVCYYLLQGTIRFYDKDWWVSYLPLVGNIVDALSRTSFAQEVISRSAAAWGPNLKYKLIEGAVGLHIIPEREGVEFGSAFNGERLQKATGAQPWNAILELILKGALVAAGTMAISALTKREEEE